MLDVAFMLGEGARVCSVRICIISEEVEYFRETGYFQFSRELDACICSHNTSMILELTKFMVCNSN